MEIVRFDWQNTDQLGNMKQYISHLDLFRYLKLAGFPGIMYEVFVTISYVWQNIQLYHKFITTCSISLNSIVMC